MIDRIDIGEAPRIGPPRAEPTTFTYTGATALTPEQYQSQFVNYANQYVGLPSLEKETGISVTAPTVEEAQAGVQAREDDDDIPSFIKAGLDREEVTFGIDSISFSNDAKNYSSYVDYLKGTGKADRIDVVENLYSPIMEGDFKDIDLSEADLFRSLREAPRELQEDIKGLSKTFKEEGVKGVVNKYGEPVAEKVLSSITGALAGPLVGAGVSGILGGTSEQNAFGKTSFRPSGILGAFYDLNSARQFQDMLHIRASEEAGLASGDYFANDRGFAMAIGNFGITRRPGANFYTGNRRGMSHKQIKDLEAISKGYLPESYRFTHDKDGQSSIFLSGDTKINQRISDDGGLMVDPNNPMAGFYKGDGTFYSPRFGYSKYGMRKDIQKLADKYGIDTTLAEQALKDARAGKGTLAGNIFKIKRDTADKDEKGESSFVPTPKPSVPSTKQEKQKRNEQIRKDDEREQADIREVQMLEAGGDFVDAFNTGGFIGMNVGGLAASKSGFVDGVPPSQATDAQEVADDKEGKLPEGAYVINASAVTFAGETDIINMLREAQEEAVRRGVTPENPKASSMIDVAVSRGEVVVAPYLVNIIGKDRLEKINNRGVKDTERKIEENGQQTQGVSRGGFLGYATGTGTLSPTVTSPQEPYEAPPLPPMTHTIYDNTYFGYRFGDIIDAIRPVEIQGFEKQPYIFTGVKVKGRKGSSAFGPMQITASTLRDLKERSGDYQMFSDEAKEYVDKLITQGRDKVNLELYKKAYIDTPTGRKEKFVSAEDRRKLQGLKAGVIPIEEHKKFYEMVANATLKQKLLDHDTLEDAISSYGEGLEYASKVLKNLGVLRKN
tara:strand:+ start:7297 stop:9810 length:2514 start_codon:yes stop_codon:yes gene_type:complete